MGDRRPSRERADGDRWSRQSGADRGARARADRLLATRREAVWELEGIAPLYVVSHSADTPNSVRDVGKRLWREAEAEKTIADLDAALAAGRTALGDGSKEQLAVICFYDQKPHQRTRDCAGLADQQFPWRSHRTWVGSSGVLHVCNRPAIMLFGLRNAFRRVSI
jgi:hypothetical protein